MNINIGIHEINNFLILTLSTSSSLFNVLGMNPHSTLTIHTLFESTMPLYLFLCELF